MRRSGESEVGRQLGRHQRGKNRTDAQGMAQIGRRKRKRKFIREVRDGLDAAFVTEIYLSLSLYQVSRFLQLPSQL
jgi:hypothetical protein